MDKTRTVVIYGNSLVASSIGAGLRERAGLRVLPLDAIRPGAVSELASLRPDVAIFDLATTQPDFAIALWKAQPDLLVIGIDPETHRALVWTGRQTAAIVADDLVNVIREYAASLAESCRSAAVISDDTTIHQASTIPRQRNEKSTRRKEASGKQMT